MWMLLLFGRVFVQTLSSPTQLLLLIQHSYDEQKDAATAYDIAGYLVLGDVGAFNFGPDAAREAMELPRFKKVVDKAKNWKGPAKKQKL